MEPEKIDYNEIFTNERNEWKQKIGEIGANMKSIKTLVYAQVDLFTQRQLLLEYSYKLGSIVIKLNTKYKSEKSKKMKEYSENTNVRYGEREKTTLIEGDLFGISEKIEMVESHRKYIDQTVQTVDHMLYAVKNRIALEDYLRGSTIK